ncbi:uncharacterized protein METZ01_LOCUS250794 [marine metagenome]|uniref:Uncharacterized protein n=1 Tax=marine metagenome TaxID=408172 RepID=A0A382IE55_9ZZZZ
MFQTAGLFLSGPLAPEAYSNLLPGSAQPASNINNCCAR